MYTPRLRGFLPEAKWFGVLCRCDNPEVGCFFQACSQHDSKKQKFSSHFLCSPNPSLSLCFWFCSHFTLFSLIVLSLLISTLSFELHYTYVLLSFLLFIVLLFKWNNKEYESGHSIGKCPGVRDRSRSVSLTVPLWAVGPWANAETSLNFDCFTYKIKVSADLREVLEGLNELNEKDSPYNSIRRRHIIQIKTGHRIRIHISPK